MPALAQTKPWWVSQIRVAPRRRTIRALSERISSQSSALLPVSSERASGLGPGRTSARATIRPSALLTTLWATIRMSPGTTPSARARAASIAPRSSPGRPRAAPTAARSSERAPDAQQQAHLEPGAGVEGRALARRRAISAIRSARRVDVEREPRALAGARAPGRGAGPRRVARRASPGPGAGAGRPAGAAASRWCRSRRRRAPAPPSGRRARRARIAAMSSGRARGRSAVSTSAASAPSVGHRRQTARDGGVHPARRVVVGHHPGAGQTLGDRGGIGVGGHDQHPGKVRDARAGTEHVGQHRHLQVAPHRSLRAPASGAAARRAGASPARPPSTPLTRSPPGSSRPGAPGRRASGMRTSVQHRPQPERARSRRPRARRGRRGRRRRATSAYMRAIWVAEHSS